MNRQSVDRHEVVATRIRAQELDRPPGTRSVADAAVLDLGVQDTGRDGASWALANRGARLASAAELEADASVALVWTLRSAPHYYRRADLPDVLVATSPFDDADAGKRLLGADKPLQEAGVRPTEGLRHVAAALRTVVTEPLVKGEVSTRVTARLRPPYLRECAPCGAVHAWEVPFRLGALHAGLELAPGTSPPVLRPIPGWPRGDLGPADDPLAAPERLQVVRGYLRFLGPAAPADVAAFLDAPVAAVKAHWPPEAVPVEVAGRTRWQLPGAAAADAGSGLVRLLGPYDLLLQGRDRELLVPDRSRHKALWPVLGRPGAVLAGTDLVGTWRPRTSGSRLTVRLDLWSPLAPPVRSAVGQEAERLAAHRGLRLAALEET